MISQLRGEVVRKDERTLTLDVGGVGYRVQPTTTTLKKVRVGQQLTLLTHLAVREDALELFGFEGEEELEYFNLLLSVPGIGPKSALATLSLAPPEVLRRAITSGDHNYLTRVAGVGKKSAEKIVLTLKDKIVAGSSDEGINLAADAETLDALKALGYTLSEAREAVKRVPQGLTETKDRIKEALKHLAHG